MRVVKIDDKNKTKENGGKGVAEGLGRRERLGRTREGKDTVAGSHTNYLRKRSFKSQLGFSSQSLDYGRGLFPREGDKFRNPSG